MSHTLDRENKMNIPFSPPDISEAEIAEVADALRSGWITTGPKTKLLEKKIAEWVGTPKCVCLNSQTACAETTLRILGIGEGDEVITTAYTYTATASVVCHVGAKLVLVDCQKDSFEMDYDELEKVITEKTKVVIPVDLGGVPCDYDRIFSIIEGKKSIFKPNNEIQEKIGRIVVVADAAHTFGASWHGKMVGSYLSVMEHGTDVQQLGSILEENSVKVMKILDFLMRRRLLAETGGGKRRMLKIREKMVRDMIYERTSQFKRLELHKLAIRYYEKIYQRNRSVYFYLSELRYHYSFTDCEYEKLYYDIMHLQYVLDYYDEFFPTVVNDEDTRNSIRLDRERIYQDMEEYTQRLEAMEDEVEFRNYEELHMVLDFLAGRSLTRDGKRKQGIVCIQKMMDRAGELERTDMLLKGYVELICYGLKEGSVEWMEKYLKEAKSTENLKAYARERGVLLRLEGYCNILKEEYDRAEQLLLLSIQLFESPKMKRANYFNVAGAYDYLALIYRRRGEYEKAGKIMEKAICLCLEKRVIKSLDLFYEDYGYILYLQGKYEEAERYFKKSARIYEEFGTYWLRSVGECCMSVIALSRNEEDKALEHFRMAEIFSQKDMTAEELKMLEETRARLKAAKVLR